MHIGNWGQTLLESLRKDGFSSQAIVGNTGVDIRKLEGTEPKISFEHLALFFERAAEITGNDLIGFEHGLNSDYRRGGLISYTGASSPCVRTLLNNLARFQRVTGDVLRIDASSLDTNGEVLWHFHAPQIIIRSQYVEFSSSLVLGILRRLTNRRVTPLSLEFRHFRKSNIDKMRQYYGCDITFGAKENLIKFKLLDLDLPLQSADEHLHELLKRVSQEALSKLDHRTPSLATSVEECIARTSGMAQTDVAKALGMSPRTLARRLTEEGTSYVRILEGYRRSMAKKMLTDTDFQLTEIAYVLGYSDPSTFSTAFKRWTTQTPSQYRETHS